MVRQKTSLANNIMISLLFLGKFHIISDAGRVQDMRQSSSVGSDQVLV